MSKKQTTRLLALTAAPAISGCGGMQSTLMPHGPAARAIADISWVMFWGSAVILALVMGLALYAVYRNPDRHNPQVSGNAMIIAGGVILPVVTLSALLIYGIYTMGSLRAEPKAGSLQIEVVGNRWWWDVHYSHGSGEKVTVANEIHIPVGVPVTVSVRTNDVIHSFWVPNLAGKIDLIPGRTNRIVLQADRAGVFRGQCAEFCGAQHARMAFYVVATSAPAFDAWLTRQRAPAAEIDSPTINSGRAAFVAHECVTCHTVRGVSPATHPGPDLTHVGSRRSLAAGALANNEAAMIDVIARSQSVKPGNAMPSYSHLDDDTLQALAAYLGSLQ